MTICQQNTKEGSFWDDLVYAVVGEWYLPLMMIQQTYQFT